MEISIFITLILIIVICEACAQSCANMYKHTDKEVYLFVGGLMYLLVVYFLSRAHKHAKMGVVNAIWSGLSVVTIASIGALVFNQKLAADQIGMMGVVLIGVSYLAIGMEPDPG